MRMLPKVRLASGGLEINGNSMISNSLIVFGKVKSNGKNQEYRSILRLAAWE